MAQSVASYYIHSNGTPLKGFVNSSSTLSMASLPHTMSNVGALDTLRASRYVLSTLMTEAEDVSVIYDALNNPFAHKALWLMAYAAQGDLFDVAGNRIPSFCWDFEYMPESGSFYLSKDILI